MVAAPNPFEDSVERPANGDTPLFVPKLSIGAAAAVDDEAAAVEVLLDAKDVSLDPGLDPADPNPNPPPCNAPPLLILANGETPEASLPNPEAAKPLLDVWLACDGSACIFVRGGDGSDL